MWLGVFAGLHSGDAAGDDVVADVGISVWMGQIWCLALRHVFFVTL